VRTPIYAHNAAHYKKAAATPTMRTVPAPDIVCLDPAFEFVVGCRKDKGNKSQSVCGTTQRTCTYRVHEADVVLVRNDRLQSLVDRGGSRGSWSRHASVHSIRWGGTKQNVLTESKEREDDDGETGKHN
jgi:hypothetical protein